MNHNDVIVIGCATPGEHRIGASSHRLAPIWVNKSDNRYGVNA